MKYEQALASHEIYTGKNYLRREEVQELRHDIKLRKANGEIAVDNYATMKSDGNGNAVLTSYYTDVCTYNPATENFTKLWRGYSATTLKHINAFRAYYGLSALSKREWVMLP